MIIDRNEIWTQIKVLWSPFLHFSFKTLLSQSKSKHLKGREGEVCPSLVRSFASE